jgi:uncharacterized protein YcbK (DUF882 family)
MAIDWKNPHQKISVYFTVKDALWLPQWNRLAKVEDGISPEIFANLLALFKQIDTVRALVNRPIIVHVAFRSKSYNKLVKGAAASSHIFGMAVDFHVQGMDCDVVRKLLVPKLEEWKMRCEDLPGSSWIHLDTREVPAGGRRFFKP